MHFSTSFKNIIESKPKKKEGVPFIWIVYMYLLYYIWFRDVCVVQSNEWF